VRIVAFATQHTITGVHATFFEFEGCYSRP
jgi:hypothetical protein